MRKAFRSYSIALEKLSRSRRFCILLSLRAQRLPREVPEGGAKRGGSPGLMPTGNFLACRDKPKACPALRLEAVL